MGEYIVYSGLTFVFFFFFFLVFLGHKIYFDQVKVPLHMGWEVKVQLVKMTKKTFLV